MPGTRPQLRFHAAGLAGALCASVLLAGCTPSPSPATPFIDQVVQGQMLAGKDVGPVTASCPAGEVALFGSWGIDPHDGSGARVYKSARNGSGSWNIYVHHFGQTQVSAFAECLKNAPSATITERAARALTLAPNSSDTTYASCNAGEVVVGGGFAFSSVLQLDTFDFTPPVGSSPASWRAAVGNLNSFSASATLYAECLTFPAAHVGRGVLESAPRESPPQAVSGAKSRCPSSLFGPSAFVSGGAFVGAGLDASIFVVGMAATDTFTSGPPGTSTSWYYASWQAIVSGPDPDFSVQAICMTFF